MNPELRPYAIYQDDGASFVRHRTARPIRADNAKDALAAWLAQFDGPLREGMRFAVREMFDSEGNIFLFKLAVPKRTFNIEAS